MPGKRDNALDILKGIGIITMVMGHSNMGETFISYVAGFHMQLFFIVSGYLFSQSKYNIFDYTRRKAKTLLFPYATFAMITLIFCCLVSIVLQSNVFDFPDCLIGIIYSNRSIFPITGALWFLQCLFWVSIIFYLCGIMGEMVRAIMIFVFLAAAWVQSYYDFWLPFALDSTLSALVLFYIGYILNMLNKPKELPNRYNLVISVILLCLTYYTIKLNGDVNPRTCSYGNNYFAYYFNAVSATVGWYFFAKCISRVAVASDNISAIGRDSIVFVGLNQLVIVSLYQLALIFYDFPNSYERALRNICIFLITIFILRVLTNIISKSKYRLLIGK